MQKAGGPGPGLLTVAATFTAGLLLAFLLAGIGTLVTDSMVAAALLFEVGLVTGAVAYLAATGSGVREVLRLRPVATAAYPLAVLLGLALLLANLSATILLGPPLQDIRLVGGAASAIARIVLVLAVVLLAPVFEEALFRGLLQGALETRLRPWPAIAVAALAFALMHGPHQAPFFFFWSLPIGWVTWRTSSVGPAIVVHAVNNVAGLVGLFAAGKVEAADVERGSGAVAFALVLLVLVVWWTVGLCRRIETRVAGPS